MLEAMKGGYHEGKRNVACLGDPGQGDEDEAVVAELPGDRLSTRGRYLPRRDDAANGGFTGAIWASPRSSSGDL